MPRWREGVRRDWSKLEKNVGGVAHSSARSVQKYAEASLRAFSRISVCLLLRVPQENIDTVQVTASPQAGDEPGVPKSVSAGGEESATIRTEIVDFPGHARLRTLAAPYLEQAAALVFLVDGADKAALKVAAE